MKIIRILPFIFLTIVAISCGMISGIAKAALPEHPRWTPIPSGESITLENAQGTRLKITPYGTYILRLQTVRKGESFFADDHYQMVESHRLPGTMAYAQDKSTLYIGPINQYGASVEIDKSSLEARFMPTYHGGKTTYALTEKGGVDWSETSITRRFYVDDQEHFTGLGHGYFGRAKSLDLKGQHIQRNYGAVPIEQAPLIVPFYISSKSYGIFLNSSFKNSFHFGDEQGYSFGIDTLGFDGRMDYFFIAGPKPKDVLAHYIQLTGKPRLPTKAMFGLALSDKSHDHNSPTPSDETWWKKKISDHRAAGFALDHVVNDNRWRAGGGKRCESYIEWDKGRYPDPAEYAAWLKKNGLVTTIDFNRCVAQYSEGWKASFNLPEVGDIEFNRSAPDLTNPEFRNWFWHILYSKSLDPALHYPGDALWIDEFDEQGAAPQKMRLANGLSSAEMRNAWFLLIAQSLGKDGWDQSTIQKRPFTWVRGMTAGAQRYATLWSGDIKPNFEEMKMQIRGMQLAGLSGFPYWGHDAGGFYDWDKQTGPDANLYMQWAMAMGSFSPIWKPHGMGPSRWPLDRSAEEQAAAHQFIQLRYELMPYTYSAAHQANETGVPIARAMLLDYPHSEQAWKSDLQYMWGDELLVAPFTDTDSTQHIWLPPGKWLDYWQPVHVIQGDETIDYQTYANKLGLFVKAGAIIPKYTYTLSTAFANKSHLNLDVYRGQNGQTTLIEDDDSSEAYRQKSEIMRTQLGYEDDKTRITIQPAAGSYLGAPTNRSYTIRILGASTGDCFTVNGKRVAVQQAADQHQSQIEVAPTNIRKKIVVQACTNARKT